MTGVRPYDQRAGFLYTDDFVKIVDYDGNEAIFMVQRHESIAQHTVKFTSRVANGGIPPGNKIFADFQFLQPARENRLFEIRPVLFAVRQHDFGAPGVGDGRLILPPSPANPIPVPTDPNRIPAGVELVWRDPAGMARGGTDLSFDVNESITAPSPPTIVNTPQVGGVNGGFVEAIMVPLIDDFSDLYKMNAIYGHTIEFGIANKTDEFWNPGKIIGGDTDDYQYFVAIVGRKHILGPVDDEIKRKINNEELFYKTITVGGIPIVTTRA
jgi:hypothetical protein